jgi:hypothetical protein
MTKVYNALPKALSPVVDINDMPIEHTSVGYKERILKLINKMFKIDEQTEIYENLDKYYDMIWNKIKDPNKKYGVVAIDGYKNDPEGNDDRALVFYMGIPKLRGRRITYLEKVYMKLTYSYGQHPMISYFNSVIEKGDKPSFNFRQAVECWHPHISGHNPCTGAFGPDYVKLWRLGNFLMFLMTCNQFLNTWNGRSAYWNINRRQIKTELGNEEITIGRIKNLKNRVLRRDIPEEVCIEFIRSWLPLIKYENIEDAINFLVQIKSEMILAEELIFNRDNIRNNGLSISNEIAEACLEAGANINSDHHKSWTISGNHRFRNNMNHIILEINNDGEFEQNNYSFSFQRVLTHFDDTGQSWTNYTKMKGILACMSETINAAWFSTSDISSYRTLIREDDIVPWFIKLWGKYYHFHDVALQNFCDNYTESNIKRLVHRAQPYSGTITAKSLKEPIERKLHNRRLRVRRCLRTRYQRILNKIDFNNAMNDLVQEHFHYELMDEEVYLSTVDNVTDRIPVIDKGLFWRDIGATYDSKRINNVINLFVDQRVPKDMKELVVAYHKLKEKLLHIERECLAFHYRMNLRRLEKNVQTNNTEENTQQIPLFFD